MTTSVPGVVAGVDKYDRATSIPLLKEMLRIRELEQRTLDLSSATPPQVIGSAHLCAGQEAVPVGTIAGLKEADQVIATYRGHGWALASGLSLTEVFGEICQRSIGRKRRPWRFGLHDGARSALYRREFDCRSRCSNRLRRRDVQRGFAQWQGGYRLHWGWRVQPGVHPRGLAFAAARSLPVLIICENNGWSELTPTSLTFKVERIAQRASGYGMPGVTIDGTDPIVVRDTIAQAAKRAREGGGPALIECRVPRFVGSLQPGYRALPAQRGS